MHEHDSRFVANDIIMKGVAGGNPLMPLQVVKLVYLCQGWMLGLYRKSLIRHDVLAWRYGPVVAEVYREVREYRREPITEKVYVPEREDCKQDVFDDIESDLLQQVYQKYGHLTGVELSRLTHARHTPWHTVWSLRGRNSVIPNNLIMEHYAAKAAAAEHSAEAA